MNLFFSNATSLTENAWKAFTRPTLFLGLVKCTQRGKNLAVALWERILAIGR